MHHRNIGFPVLTFILHLLYIPQAKWPLVVKKKDGYEADDQETRSPKERENIGLTPTSNVKKKKNLLDSLFRAVSKNAVKHTG